MSSSVIEVANDNENENKGEREERDDAETKDSLPRPGLKRAYCKSEKDGRREGRRAKRIEKEEGEERENEPGNKAKHPAVQRGSTTRECNRYASSPRRGRLRTTSADPR